MKKSSRSSFLFGGMFAIVCVAMEGHSQHLLVPHGNDIFETSHDRGAAMIQGVDNIGICGKDLKRAISFYEKLGSQKGTKMTAALRWLRAQPSSSYSSLGNRIRRRRIASSHYLITHPGSTT